MELSFVGACFPLTLSVQFSPRALYCGLFVIFITTCEKIVFAMILVSLYCCFVYPLTVRVDYFTFWSKEQF